MVEGTGEGFNCHIRPFLDAAGAFHQPVHQKAPQTVEHRGAVAVAAVVKADDDP